MAFRGKARPGAQFGAKVRSLAEIEDKAYAGGKWGITCLDGQLLAERKDEFERLIHAKGQEYRLDIADQMKILKWQEDWNNIITDVGLTYLIGVALVSVVQITTWYVGLVNGTTPVFDAGDTAVTHAGWTEDVTYSEATRVTWTGAATTAGITTNTASVATFTMSGSTTIGGAFLISHNVKGDQTTGTLYAEGDFSPDRVVVNLDVLEVTGQLFVADDGV